jgi:hypothetical protein
MKLNTRFALLLGFLLAALIGSAVALTRAHERQMRESIELLHREQSAQLDQMLGLTAYPLQQFVRDYSLWDDMCSYVEAPDENWAKINLENSLDTFRLQGAWVLRTDGTVVYHGKRGPTPAAVWTGSAAEFARTTAGVPFAHYFARVGNDVYEVQVAPIQPSSDTSRVSSPRGFLVGARAWDPGFLQSLAEITRAQVRLDQPSAPSAHDAESGVIEVVRELNGLDAKPIALLRLHLQPEQLARLKSYGGEVLWILMVQGVLGLLGLMIGLRLWVAGPFKRIATTLATRDARHIEDVEKSPSELGKIARLVKEHFASEVALRRSERALGRALEERVKLGRELHDGVIQSMYAAGMGLAAVRSELRIKPDSAEKTLDEIRARLNETIRDVRSHIVRLELDELTPKGFSQHVRETVDGLGLTPPPALTLKIDDSIADSLSVAALADALQKLRESVLSAHRRGATAIAVELVSTAAAREFVIITQGENPSAPAVLEGLRQAGWTRRDDGTFQRVLKYPTI